MTQRTVEVTHEQLAEVARQFAKDAGNADPDVLVFPGPLREVDTPYGNRLLVAPAPSTPLPLWKHFVGTALRALAEAGKLAGVTFVVLTEKKDAA